MGKPSAKRLPERSASPRPRRVCAERLTSVMRPLAIETDDASRHARQHGLHEAAALGKLFVCRDRASRWLFSSRVMVLKVDDRRRRSPSPRFSGSSIFRLPRRHLLGRPIRRRIGATKRPANHMPTQMAASSAVIEIISVHEAVRELEAAARFSQPLEFVDVCVRYDGLLDDDGAHAARHVEIPARIVAAASRPPPTR